MRIISVSILFPLVVHSYAEAVTANHNEGLVNKVVDTLVGKLSNRALEARAMLEGLTLNHADLDTTMLRKVPSNVATPSCASVRPFPPLIHTGNSLMHPFSVPSSTQSTSSWAPRKTMQRGDTQKRCAVQYALDRQDPNWTPGAVKNLRYVDKPPPPKFNDVQVRVYNIDRYGMSPLAAKALGKNIEAIWHVGVTVFGREYWYGAVVEAQNLTQVDYAFGFGPSHVYNIGTTDLDPDEFHKWVFEDRFNEYRPDTYDCFNHNCHHFANDLVIKLTGKTPQTGGFPQWCLDHGEKALSEKTEDEMKAITWVSNRIAKVMMISWGKYNRERFVDKQNERASLEREIAR